MECAGIADLVKGCNLGGGVRLRAGHLDNGAAESNTGLVERVILNRFWIDVGIETPTKEVPPATASRSVSISSRIMMIYSKELKG